MNDELSKMILGTKEKIAQALNESNLHPMILQMILNDFMHQIDDALRNVPKETANDNTDV